MAASMKGDEDCEKTGPTERDMKKDFKSSVIIMPPEECWDQIQKIRSQHDKAYKRWMPHINMLYPFINREEDVFKEAAEKLSVALKDVSPFRVKFSKASFSNFAHKKNCTLWLSPLDPADEGLGASGTSAEGPGQQAASLPVPHASVKNIQHILENVFPMCDDLSKRSDEGFIPHLSLGQFQPRKINSVVDDFQKDWQDVEFEVNCIYLISRQDYHDPFHIRYSVPLGGSKPKAMDYAYQITNDD